MKYQISYENPQSHYINLELHVDQIAEDAIELQLPAWRPGRYVLQNFAKNIQKFEVLDGENKPIAFKKITKDRWRIETKNCQEIKVRYNYFAHQMDAGGCWLDADQLYINWICCALYIEDRIDEAYELHFSLPDNYQMACSLTTNFKTRKLSAKDFHQLVDAPLIASPSLQHQTYTCQNATETTFHIWVQGNWQADWKKILQAFKDFSETQIQLFKDFVSKDYHFLFQILPYKHYHGVEHHDSTVITLGPDYDMNDKYFVDFLAISSHELFHYWNVKRIRPVEMMPYDYKQENYFKTGFVIEGITTYYGDYLLGRSKVLDQKTLFKELNTTLQRHFANEGRHNLSVADSSFDLWLDGYEKGIPNRKTSIYAKGAVVAFILDLEIRKKHQNKRSLDDVMRSLWRQYSLQKVGFSEENYQKVVEEVAQEEMHDYFDNCVYGNETLEGRLQSALDWVGLTLEIKANDSVLQNTYGIKTSGVKVTDVAMASPAEPFICIGDELIAINNYKVDIQNIKAISKAQNESISLHLFRQGQLHEITLKSDTKQSFFNTYCLTVKPNQTEEQKNNFKAWLGDC